MVDSAHLSEFWNREVPREFRHIVGTEFDRKIETYLASIRTHMLDRIDFDEVDQALDWGCGGGLITALLARKCPTAVVDISEDSLAECARYLAEQSLSIATAHQLGEPEALVLDGQPDLLFSASVVQHFPSLSYWRRVAAVWNRIAPRWIAVQTRHGAENRWNEETYFDETRNYILGLVLTTEEVKARFADRYDLRYHHFEEDGHSDYEYFVFRRKTND